MGNFSGKVGQNTAGGVSTHHKFANE
uniref:Uncharacterized protein n=1 Tax=Arundo donax TaxID=35708 RepID=A0A0A9HA56_ARUDO